MRGILGLFALLGAYASQGTLLPADYGERTYDAPGKAPQVSATRDDLKAPKKEALQKLTLPRARSLALARNHTKAAAAAAVDAARARVLEARAVVTDNRNAFNQARFAQRVFLARIEFLVGVPRKDWGKASKE